MGKMGETVKGGEVEEMIKLADVSGSGGVNFSDLEALMLD